MSNRTYHPVSSYSPGMKRNLIDGYKDNRGDGGGSMFELPEGLNTDEEILQWIERTSNLNSGEDEDAEKNSSHTPLLDRVKQAALEGRG